jgi:hypothetical protein
MILVTAWITSVTVKAVQFYEWDVVLDGCQEQRVTGTSLPVTSKELKDEIGGMQVGCR